MISQQWKIYQFINTFLICGSLVESQWRVKRYSTAEGSPFAVLCLFITRVTWLILPVVICLSQRLSHACLSINNFVLWNCEWLITSVIIYLIVPYYLDNRGNSRANTCEKSRLLEGMYLLDKKPIRATCSWWFMITLRIVWLYVDDGSFKFLPYQLSMVRSWPTMVVTGNGELGFDSGEGAWEMATTSKEGSRRANYPILTQGGSDKK